MGLIKLRRKKQLSKLQITVSVLFVLLAALLAAIGPGSVIMPSQTDGLYVHFIDVGQADCSLLLCGDEAMLIDGGNAADSDLVYAYLEKRRIKHLKYIVNTHAHEDHVGGLSGALNYAQVDYALCPVTKYDTKVFANFVYYLAQQGKQITVPSPGDTFTIGEAQVAVLGPLQNYEETNNTSIVLRVVYGQTSFLFTGDAETAAENDLLDSGQPLRSTVLKVGHHGSNSSSSADFLAAVAPQYAVISCETNNSYGHPHQEVLDRLNDIGAEIYRTDKQGTIIAKSDGETVTFTTEKKSH